MVKHLLERIDDHLTLLRKDVFQLAELAPTVRQTVTADQRLFICGIAGECIGHHQRLAVVNGALGQQRLEVLSSM